MKQEIEQKKRQIIKNINARTLYTIGSNASHLLELNEDIRDLTTKMVIFLLENYPDINYEDFYDKKVLTILKNIIKDEQKFKVFLKSINYTLNDFLNIGVYVCPQVFTTNIIKFIRITYLELEVKDD